MKRKREKTKAHTTGKTRRGRKEEINDRRIQQRQKTNATRDTAGMSGISFIHQRQQEAIKMEVRRFKVRKFHNVMIVMNFSKEEEMCF